MALAPGLEVKAGDSQACGSDFKSRCILKRYIRSLQKIIIGKDKKVLFKKTYYASKIRTWRI